jgi:hypothetical protein
MKCIVTKEKYNVITVIKGLLILHNSKGHTTLFSVIMESHSQHRSLIVPRLCATSRDHLDRLVRFQV